MVKSLAVLGTLLLSLQATAATAVQPGIAPKPLYRDPIDDGAADVSLIYDRAVHDWKMFYTSRRARMRAADPSDVAWVHGTPIGVARSKDGLNWHYTGTARFPAECTGETLWAPDLFYDKGIYHMWLSVVPGIYHHWGEAGATARIVHLTSPDLQTWSCSDTVDLKSERVIDADVFKVGDHYRLWYKDERRDSRIFAVDSYDLVQWFPEIAQPANDEDGEGPAVFRFGGYYWLIYDAWHGLRVLRSCDAHHWTAQADTILQTPGQVETDNGPANHPDIVVTGKGKAQRAFIYYFVHQSNAAEARTDPYWHQRTVIQVAELHVAAGGLTVSRDRPVHARLGLPAPGEGK